MISFLVVNIAFLVAIIIIYSYMILYLCREIKNQYSILTEMKNTLTKHMCGMFDIIKRLEKLENKQ
jgi:hypothetical protein